MSMLLDPRGVQSMPMGGFPNAGQPSIMDAPQVPQQQMQQANFGQRFKQNMGPMLQALGYGIASGNLGRGAAILPELADRRQRSMAEQQQMAQQQQQLNMTKEWLKQKGRMDLVPLVDAGQADVALRMATQQEQGQNQTALLQEYEYAKSQGYEGSLMDFREGMRGSGVTYGTSPQWIRKPEGGWGFGVIGSDGTFKQVETPEGLAGPEGVAESRAAGTEIGKVRGGAKANLPQAEFQVSTVKQHVNSIITDPYLPSMTGPVNAMLPNVTGDAARFKSKVEQLKGDAFLGARAALKGGGQITDYEGQRAEAALLRAAEAQHPEDFKAAMMEFQLHMERGLEILRLQAGQGGAGDDPELEDALKQYGN
jgi:hypothetical protein